MSLERAKINCERCYQIASQTKKGSSGPGFEGQWADKVYTVRNEAMRALEGVMSDTLMPLTIINISNVYMGKYSTSIDLTKKPLERLQNIAGICLAKCAECDGCAPNIAKFISENRG